MSDAILFEAHKHSISNRAEIESADVCGCFCCLRVVLFSEIDDWTDGGRTAICPKCGVDSLIAETGDFPRDRTFLAKMRARWFGVEAK